jgi:hypothetical protein
VRSARQRLAEDEGPGTGAEGEDAQAHDTGIFDIPHDSVGLG